MAHMAGIAEMVHQAPAFLSGHMRCRRRHQGLGPRLFRYLMYAGTSNGLQ